MLFDNFSDLVRVAIISVLAYASLVVVLRLSGKRALAKLNAFDLVVTVALGSTLATLLLSKDVAFAEGLLAFAVLAGLQWVVAKLSIASPVFKSMVRSKPRLLLEGGCYRDAAMASERVTRSEVNAAIRNAGIGHLRDVGAVVLETDGSMSVIRNSSDALDVLVDVAS